MKVNKFNIHWQITRVEAKKIKDPKDKIAHVMLFLDSFPNYYNYYRVLNWAKMTKLGYKDERSINLFNTALHFMEQHKRRYIENREDMDNSFDDVSTENLEMVYKDLQKRKYDFQYRGQPKDDKEFQERLKEEINKRRKS